MSAVFLFGSSSAGFVTDMSGKTGIAPGFPVSDFTVTEIAFAAPLITDDDAFFTQAIGFPAQSVQPALITDADAFHTPLVVIVQALQAALVTDDDTIPATTLANVPVLRPGLIATDDAFFVPGISAGPRVVAPGRVTETDTIFSSFATLVPIGAGGPQQKLKAPPKVQDSDIIFQAALSSTTGVVLDVDVIRAPIVTASAGATAAFVSETDTIFGGVGITTLNMLRPLLVASDDATYDVMLSRVFEPVLLNADDDVPAADVGWQVIAELTNDTDEVFAVDAYAFYPLYPEVWIDEEHIDTYPFFVQQVQGGVPVPPREGVLKGSLKRSPHLIGSLTKKKAA